MYEVEIKSLLGSKESADTFRNKLLKSVDNHAVEKGKHSQRNHYFVATENNLESMREKVAPHISENKKELFEEVLKLGQKHSVRSREADGVVLLVVKASVDEGTSSNTVSRMEFEGEMHMSLEDLDALLLDCGLKYQAKWSREREEFEIDDMNVTIDKNAGYGYVAEFEKTTSDENHIADIKRDLLNIMQTFGLSELPQERLERMFEYYNNNWEAYYGTENVFEIK